jgi:catechol 2,3-dioxygenase-like lactoylglutathione lyase family enzyme
MNNQLTVHVALNVNDIEKSADFYRAMFGVDPVRLKPGYAKFDVAEPALNLTLNYTDEVKEERGALNHLGIQVYSTDAVLEAKQRLQTAGLATFDENGYGLMLRAARQSMGHRPQRLPMGSVRRQRGRHVSRVKPLSFGIPNTSRRTELLCRELLRVVEFSKAK